jgi:hypothetical protein
MEHNNDFKFDLEFGILGEKLLAEIFTNKKVEVSLREYQLHKLNGGVLFYQAKWKIKSLLL